MNIENNLAPKSYFDGGLIELVAISFIGVIITVFSFGIAFPWALTLNYSWQVNHTVINGKRLHFNGTAIGLIGNWIKWLILIFITLGVYSFWVGIALEKWKVKNTSFA